MSGNLFIIVFPCENYEEIISSKHIVNESKSKNNAPRDNGITKQVQLVGSSSDDEFNYYYQRVI